MGQHGHRRHVRPRRAAGRSGSGSKGRVLRIELCRRGDRSRSAVRPRRRRRRVHREHRHHADVVRCHGRRRAGAMRRLSAHPVPARRPPDHVARRGVLRVGLARHLHPATATHEWPWDRRLERQNLAVRRSRDRAFVHFGDGSWRCFDLAADPTWQTEVTDPEIVLAEAAAMLSWRSRQPRPDDDRHVAAGRRHRSQANAGPPLAVTSLIGRSRSGQAGHA